MSTKREDPDLEFLRYCSDEDLRPLALHLAYGDDNTPRAAASLDTNPHFAKDAANLGAHWADLADELQRFGGDTLANLARGGEGVYYREILRDVGKACKAPCNESWHAMQQEGEILQTIIQRAFKNMNHDEQQAFAKNVSDGLKDATPEQRAALIKAMGVKDLKGITPALASAIVQTGIRAGGFLSYQILLIGLNAVSRALVGRGLQFAANTAAARTLGIFLGPIGWIITASLTVPMITGPAYRVTIPAVVQIAGLRRKIFNHDAF